MRHMGGFTDVVFGRAVEGHAALACRVWHCVETPVGKLPQDPKWGWGLAQRLGDKVAGGGDLKTEANVGRAAIRRDPEVRDVSISITERSTGRYRVQIFVYPIEGLPFDIDRELSS